MKIRFQVKRNLWLLTSLLFIQLEACVGIASAQAPTAPTGLTATAGNAQVSLTWAASAGATSYHVKRALTSGGFLVLISVPTTTSFIDTGLANGTTYFYAVSAANSVGKSGNTSSVSATPTGSTQASGQAPAVPTALRATAGNAQVSLMWAASAGATSYHVKRALTSGGPLVLISVPTTTSFIDTGLTNGTTYFYAVSAASSVGKSGNTSSVSATPAGSTQASGQAPAVPTGLTATAGNAQASLAWTASAGATGYHVKRALTSGGPFVLVSQPTTTSFIDAGLTNGTTYFYATSAVNSVGESANSFPANAKPTTPTTGQTPASITISPLQPSVAIGSKVQLSAIATSTDGSTQDVTSSFSWASSDPRKLSVSSSGLAEGLASGAVTVSGSYNSQNVSTDVSVSIGNIQWSGPIVITSGGIYSGNWETTDPNVYAVTVNTKDPVIIENSHIRGPATLISAGTAGSDLTVRNTAGLGLIPNVAGLPNGLFLDAVSPSRLVVENCYMENTRYGIRVSGYGGNRDGNQSIIIRYNRARNMTGLVSNGLGGQMSIRSTLSQGSNSYRKFSHFIQIKFVQAVPGIDIGWNEVVNEPYKSNIDDVVNIYQSSGTPTSLLAVHDSYIQGAYPYDPTIDHFSGGGITTDGTANDTPATASAYVSFHDNQVISTDNYGIGFATGHNLEAFNNRIVSSGLLANGTQISLQNLGLGEVDAYGTNVANGSEYGNSMHDNTIGWMCWRPTCASNGLPEALTAYRREMYFPLSPNEYSKNFIMQENPITLTMEEDEYQAWLQKVQTNAITVGPTF